RFPIANVSLMSSTSTIFSMIVACLWLKERINTGQLISIVIAFFGVVCIIKPTGNLIQYEAFVGLIGGASAGIAYTIVRSLKDESPYLIAFFFSVFGFLASFPLTLIVGYQSVGFKELGILLLAGIVTALGQFTLSKAYSYAPSTKISVYLYSQSLFSLLLGMILFHELPDLISLFGGTLLICGGILNFISGKKAYLTR
ncbi:MAG: DMT family transporter, partial [Holdemanella sp.]|nr:DMT family transporter [Holdemanella sp.]